MWRDAGNEIDTGWGVDVTWKIRKAMEDLHVAEQKKSSNGREDKRQWGSVEDTDDIESPAQYAENIQRQRGSVTATADLAGTRYHPSGAGEPISDIAVLRGSGTLDQEHAHDRPIDKDGPADEGSG